MAEEPGPKRLVKKVVIGYDMRSLPPALIRSFTLLRGKISRKFLRIEVVLRPLSMLPADTDVLFVPAELLEAAEQAAPQAARIAPLDASKTQQMVFDELLKDLESGVEIYAQAADDAEDKEKKGTRGGVIVRYRGNERIG